MKLKERSALWRCYLVKFFSRCLKVLHCEVTNHTAIIATAHVHNQISIILICINLVQCEHGTAVVFCIDELCGWKTWMLDMNWEKYTKVSMMMWFFHAWPVCLSATWKMVSSSGFQDMTLWKLFPTTLYSMNFSRSSLIGCSMKTM